MRKLLPLACVLLIGAAPARPAPVVPYAERAEVQAFIGRVAEKHGFDESELRGVFRHARHEPAVIKAIMPPRDPSIRSWQRYRSRYLDDYRIENGLRFWRENQGTLERAELRYGVPAEVIVAIIGVETVYGRHTGRFSTLSALTTLAFDYPPRAELFLRELEELLVLARERGSDPREFFGSYAGAIGLPQFLPSSIRAYAIDFDGDGRVDLRGSAGDAVGSVARFLSSHGWQPGAPVGVPAVLNGTDPTPLVDAGILPRHTVEELRAMGIDAEGVVPPQSKAALIDLVTPGAATEYWLGLNNFYVITRYNRSSFYAMAVYQLAEALRAARSGSQVEATP